MGPTLTATPAVPTASWGPASTSARPMQPRVWTAMGTSVETRKTAATTQTTAHTSVHHHALSKLRLNRQVGQTVTDMSAETRKTAATTQTMAHTSVHHHALSKLRLNCQVGQTVTVMSADTRKTAAMTLTMAHTSVPHLVHKLFVIDLIINRAQNKIKQCDI